MSKPGQTGKLRMVGEQTITEKEDNMKTKELVRDAFLAAILLVLQVSLSWLPNVELVSLLLILYTLVFRRHVWFILYVFVILEGLIYGFGLWWFSYLYVWAILCGSVFLMGWNGKPRSISAALLAGIFGMLFGLLCAVSYFFTGGIGAAFAWWTAGIPFDIVHGISNFAVTLLLFDPLYCLLSRLKNQF